MLSPRPAHDRPLVVTTTGEPLQPVRLYYTLPPAGQQRVRRRLESLRCVAKIPRVARWAWWHRGEAADLDFSAFARTAGPSPTPVILGIFAFRGARALELRLRSYHRAWLAARFFAPRLGDQVVLTRARVLNRLLNADHGAPDLDAIDELLDHDVVVCDPAEGEARWEAMLAARPPGGEPPTLAELEQLARDAFPRRRDDVPEVEDFPLCPEEETPAFTDLKTTLELRLMRALYHRQGRTEVTLPDIIREMVEGASAWAEDPAAGPR